MRQIIEYGNVSNYKARQRNEHGNVSSNLEPDEANY